MSNIVNLDGSSGASSGGGWNKLGDVSVSTTQPNMLNNIDFSGCSQIMVVANHLGFRSSSRVYFSFSNDVRLVRSLGQVTDTQTYGYTGRESSSPYSGSLALNGATFHYCSFVITLLSYNNTFTSGTISWTNGSIGDFAQFLLSSGNDFTTIDASVYTNKIEYPTGTVSVYGLS